MYFYGAFASLPSVAKFPLIVKKTFLHLCITAERKLHRFGTTWGRVNEEDRVFVSQDVTGLSTGLSPAKKGLLYELICLESSLPHRSLPSALWSVSERLSVRLVTGILLSPRMTGLFLHPTGCTTRAEKQGAIFEKCLFSLSSVTRLQM